MEKFVLPSNRPALMGILNVTPDSFSDGGLYGSPQEAIDVAKRMIDEGADLIDVGGESTRPGSMGVDAAEEIARVLPVIKELAKSDIAVSIDTSKAEVAHAAIGAGALIVNDVTAFGDPDMLETVVKANCCICIMHMQGSPRTMQEAPAYADVVNEVRSFLITKAMQAIDAGVQPTSIWIDPGIGFGKTVDHNLSLIKHLSSFTEGSYPVLVGASRKSFIGKLLGGSTPLPASDRLEGTLAVQAYAQLHGSKVIRAHDVLASRKVIDILAALQDAD